MGNRGKDLEKVLMQFPTIRPAWLHNLISTWASKMACARLAAEERTGRLAADLSPYFAVGSFFTSWSMNSNQNPCGSDTKNMRVVGAMKTGAFDGSSCANRLP